MHGTSEGQLGCEGKTSCSANSPYTIPPEGRLVLQALGHEVSKTSQGNIRFRVEKHNVEITVKDQGRRIRANFSLLFHPNSECTQSVACFTEADPYELEMSAQTMLETIVADAGESIGGWELLRSVISAAAKALSQNTTLFEPTLQMLQRFVSGFPTDTQPRDFGKLLCVSGSSSHSAFATLDVLLKIPESDSLCAKSCHLGMDLSFPILLRFTGSTVSIHVKLDDPQKKFIFEAIQDRLQWFFVQRAKPSHLPAADSSEFTPPIDLVEQTVGAFLDHVANLHKKCLVCGEDTWQGPAAPTKSGETAAHEAPPLRVCAQNFCMYMHQFKLDAVGVLTAPPPPPPPPQPRRLRRLHSSELDGARFSRSRVQNLVQLRVLLAMEAARAVTLRPERAVYIFAHRPRLAQAGGDRDCDWATLGRVMQELSKALEEPERGGGGDAEGEASVFEEEKVAAGEEETAAAEEASSAGGGCDEGEERWPQPPDAEAMRLRPVDPQPGPEDNFFKLNVHVEGLAAAATGRHGPGLSESADASAESADEHPPEPGESELSGVTVLAGPEQLAREGRTGAAAQAVHRRLQAKNASQECIQLAAWLFSVAPFPTLTLLADSGRFKCFDDPSVMQVMVGCGSHPDQEEAHFRAQCSQLGCQFLFHGSRLENWNQIITSGLKVMSGTPQQQNGARCGPGIYLSHDPSMSWSYSLAANDYRHFGFEEEEEEEPSGAFVLAICQVVGNPTASCRGVFVVTDEALVRVRFLVVIKPGSGDFESPLLYQEFGEQERADVDSHARKLLGLETRIAVQPEHGDSEEDQAAEQHRRPTSATVTLPWGFPNTPSQPALRRSPSSEAAATAARSTHAQRRVAEEEQGQLDSLSEPSDQLEGPPAAAPVERADSDLSDTAAGSAEAEQQPESEAGADVLQRGASAALKRLFESPPLQPDTGSACKRPKPAACAHCHGVRADVCFACTPSVGTEHDKWHHAISILSTCGAVQWRGPQLFLDSKEVTACVLFDLTLPLPLLLPSLTRKNEFHPLLCLCSSSQPISLLLCSGFEAARATITAVNTDLLSDSGSHEPPVLMAVHDLDKLRQQIKLHHQELARP